MVEQSAGTANANLAENLQAFTAGAWVEAYPQLSMWFAQGLGHPIHGGKLFDNPAKQGQLQCWLVGAELLDLTDELARQTIAELAQTLLLVVVLDPREIERSSDYFRLGAVDVVGADATQKEILAAAARIQRAFEERAKTLAYSAQLESTNRQLQESLQLLRQDQLAGLEVQKSLMPDSPLTFGNYEISHAVRPSLYLSGDFVGYNFALDRYLLFYFADVSGHGASSAFVTVLLRFMIGRVIRRHIYEHDYEALAKAPDGLVEHINSQLLATGLGKHLTLFAGSLDLHTDKLRYVVGAQLPPPVLSAAGKATYLPGKGRPAGLFEEASWQVEELTMPKESALLLLSDGVLDFIDGDNLVAKEQQLLTQLQGQVSCLDELQDRLGVSFVDELQDDVSMLLLKRNSR